MKQEVLNYLLTVPKGKVTTYGRIANAVGSPGASRAVGNILHRNPNPDIYPCYKVVDRKGRLSKDFAFGGLEEQKRRLEADGIKVDGNKVDLDKYLF